LIDKNQIQALIPHAGAMCLLEAVTAWDAQSIACVTETHRDPANPLRRQGRLPAVMAFEYGGQAAAIHGGLRARAAGQTAPPGYLAALRDARWFVADLDGIAEPLEIAAQLLLGDQAHCLYAIQVSAAGRLLAEARIAIVPQAAAETGS
jgi:predicted hotdog family 3-hydroxylacyl-ACP dehydratase